MKNYWNISLALSVIIHTFIFTATPKIIFNKLMLDTDKDIKEIEIVMTKITSKEAPTNKNLNDTLLKYHTPPPYLDDLFIKKEFIDKKNDLALDKPVILDNNLKNIIFSKLPEEKELKKNPAYMDYYHLIREKIRANAYRNYNLDETGEVFLTFIILKNGQLLSLYLNEYSIDNKELIAISLKSIKDAAPFPPFPKTLNYPKLQFNVSIHFKNN